MIGELQGRIDKLEQANARRMITITGLHCSDKKYIYKQQVEAFFMEVMDLSVEIEDVYKMGTPIPETLVVSVPTVSMRKQIFANLEKVKNIVNKPGRWHNGSAFVFCSCGCTFESEPSPTSAHACGEVTGCAPAAKRSASVAPEVNLGECTLHSPPQK